MKRIHVIGGKNHGKTTLVVELVRELSRRSLRVGTIKHTHHHHELDTPGKDSHRHREAGAGAVGILSPSMNAVFWAPNQPTDVSQAAEEHERRYAAFTPMFQHCDLVVVGGDSRADAPKLEVWRAELETPPLAATDPSIAAIITNDAADPEIGVPQWRRSDVEQIAQNLLDLGRH